MPATYSIGSVILTILLVMDNMGHQVAKNGQKLAILEKDSI